MKQVIVALTALVAVAAEEPPIYRTTDAAGHTVFSDRALPGARPVLAKRVNTYAAPAAEPGPSSKSAPASTGPSRYESLEIVSPEAGATVRANGGSVVVEGRLVPDLAAGHQVAVALDGETAACTAQAGGRFACPLSAMARGPHTVRVAVLDETGAVVLQTGATSFHVLRASVVRRSPIARDAGMH